MSVPVVLPVVDISVDHAGLLSVDVDGQPYAPQSALLRSDLPQVLATITRDRRTPVRVTVTEANGARFADIATPPDDRVNQDSDEDVAAGITAHTSPPHGPAISATGFRPGEEVAVAYVVFQGVADEQGQASLRLPPAVLARHREDLILFGFESGTLTDLHPPLATTA